jgi:hypothetical protein
MAANSPQRNAPADSPLLVSSVGRLCAAFSSVRAVGIANLAQVVEHRIVSIVGSTSHHVTFISGGELYYVFNARNELVEMSSTTALRCTLTPEGNCLFAVLTRQHQGWRHRGNDHSEGVKK